VPAAAVIPAPIAYTKVVAVKKLVVGFLAADAGPPLAGRCAVSRPQPSSGRARLTFTCRARDSRHLL
jgi:hypothetical protein